MPILCYSRRPTPSGMSIMKRVRTDEIQLEKIVSETDEQITKLAQNQSNVQSDISEFSHFNLWYCWYNTH